MCHFFSLQEVFWPIYFILILGGVKLGVRPNILPPIPEFPENTLDSDNVQFYPQGKQLILVTPNTQPVKNVMERVIQDFGGGNYSYQLFESVDNAEDHYRKNNSQVAAGIDFFDGTLATNMSYMIRSGFTDVPKTSDMYGDVGKRESNRNVTSAIVLLFT